MDWTTESLVATGGVGTETPLEEENRGTVEAAVEKMGTKEVVVGIDAVSGEEVNANLGKPGGGRKVVPVNSEWADEGALVKAGKVLLGMLTGSRKGRVSNDNALVVRAGKGPVVIAGRVLLSVLTEGRKGRGLLDVLTGGTKGRALGDNVVAQAAEGSVITGNVLLGVLVQDLEASRKVVIGSLIIRVGEETRVGAVLVGCSFSNT